MIPATSVAGPLEAATDLAGILILAWFLNVFAINTIRGYLTDSLDSCILDPGMWRVGGIGPWGAAPDLAGIVDPLQRQRQN